MRTLICIVSYQAEHHIAHVLRRLPEEVWRSEAYHVLLSDDASTDNTIQNAKNALKELGSNYTIIQLFENQGYGGNQKVCYRYAIEKGYDNVVLLHGDGQYAPELALRFPRLIKKDGADVILGSRMKEKTGALQGRMPWYKFLGNMFLTWVQNHLSNKKISEYHTGYRAYTTEFLKKVPFELNSDDFHFDTEILLQAFHTNAKIVEFAIATHYGEEVCRVPLLAYAWNVLSTTVNYKLQRMGLRVSLKFPHSSEQVYANKLDDPGSTHSHALRFLKQKVLAPGVKILDIGCGPGHLAKALETSRARYTGIDRQKPTEADMQGFQEMDLERDPWAMDISEFDTVLLLDVIEHLATPEQFLIDMRNSMQTFNTPWVLVSTANVGFVLIRINLLFGRFNYADRGILDITHKRLFTKASFKRLLRETGYRIETIHGVGVPLRTLGKGWVFRVLGGISSALARVYPSLFGFQLFAVVRPKPTTYQVIERSVGQS